MKARKTMGVYSHQKMEMAHAYHVQEDESYTTPVASPAAPPEEPFPAGFPIPKFTLSLYEVKQLGDAAASGDAMATVAIEEWLRVSHTGTPVEKNGRLVYSINLESPVPVPTFSLVKLQRERSTVLERIAAGMVPGLAAATDRTPKTVRAGSVGYQMELSETNAAMTPARLKAEFPGYADLPDEKWVQLNPETDPFVVQLKLRKTPPRDIWKCFSRGDYYVYRIVRVVIHEKPSAV